MSDESRIALRKLFEWLRDDNNGIEGESEISKIALKKMNEWFRDYDLDSKSESTAAIE